MLNFRFLLFYSVLLDFVFNLNPHIWGCSVGYLDVREFVQKEIANNSEIMYCDKDFLENGIQIAQTRGIQSLQGELFSTKERRGHEAQHTNGAIIMNVLKHYTNQLDWREADVVYVYDFCFKTVVDPSPEKDQHRDLLQLAYSRLLETSKWVENKGKNFVFLTSHPGEYELDSHRCNKDYTGNAIHAFTERGMGCKYAKQTDILIPYVSNDILKINKEFTDRQKLLCYLGGVSESGTPGKRLRYYSVKILGSLGDEDVLMNDVDNQQVSHQELMQTYNNCKYCLVLAGDTVSSRRLGEVILGGCIPVFVGPPFHNAWLTRYVPYQNFAVFIYVQNREWDGILPKSEKSKYMLRYQFPTEGMIYELQNITQLPEFLRSISDQDADLKLTILQKHQSKFEYIPNPRGSPSAIDVLFRHSCSQSKR